jgi:hypothetical protein
MKLEMSDRFSSAEDLYNGKYFQDFVDNPTNSAKLHGLSALLRFCSADIKILGKCTIRSCS